MNETDCGSHPVALCEVRSHRCKNTKSKHWVFPIQSLLLARQSRPPCSRQFTVKLTDVIQTVCSFMFTLCSRDYRKTRQKTKPLCTIVHTYEQIKRFSLCPSIVQGSRVCRYVHNFITTTCRSTGCARLSNNCCTEKFTVSCKSADRQESHVLYIYLITVHTRVNISDNRQKTRMREEIFYTFTYKSASSGMIADRYQ